MTVTIEVTKTRKIYVTGFNLLSDKNNNCIFNMELNLQKLMSITLKQ